VLVDAAAAAVGAAPVCWVGDEVEDGFGWVGEGCFGGDAEFSYGWLLALVWFEVCLFHLEVWVTCSCSCKMDAMCLWYGCSG
jgi:hypothetical protein